MTLDEKREALLFVRTRVTLHPAATHGKAVDTRVTVDSSSTTRQLSGRLHPPDDLTR